ncbi:MAG: gliding motility-associated C-terminal domain-containing protein [Bacteroidota bacterium]
MIGSSKYRRIFVALAVVLSMLFFPGISRAPQDIPDKPDMIRVTVEHADNGVLIQWEASTDSDISSYLLYKMSNGTGVLIDSVPVGTLQYKHMTSGLENLAYTVTAADSLGNESLLEENEHRAVALSLEYDPCEPANTLNWTGYVGWEGQISGYRIYGGIAEQEPHLLKFVNAQTRSYHHREVSFDSTYTYYIETVHTSGMISHSPKESITSSFPNAPEFLRMDYVSVLDRSTVELQFTTDLEGPVNSFRIMKRSNPDSPFSEVETVVNLSQSTWKIQDMFPTTSVSNEYVVQAIHQPEGCSAPMVVSESNPGTSILLESTLDGHLASLVWTPYKAYVNGLSGYIIQRKSGDGEFIDVQTVGAETTSWHETIESVINGFQPGQLQYKVIAVSNQGEGSDSGFSISNTASVEVESHLRVPTAFTPGSGDMNDEFKPIIDFAPRKYLLIVFDRGGRKLFETTDPGRGWNGTFRGGDYVMEGVYVYYIQYTDYTGLFRTLSGNVTAIYP